MTHEKSYVDLHVHTNYSDGSFTPTEAVTRAKEIGLSAIAITDHDTTDGLPEANEAGARLGVEVIAGIELSSEYTDPERTVNEMHILGYFMDWQNEDFQKTLSYFRESRKKRADSIIEKLHAAGVNFDDKKLFETAGRGVIGRLHFAKVLLEQRLVNNISDAFNRFLGFGRPAYVPKARLTPEEAIKLILNVGGIPVLAHPHYGQFNDKTLLNTLAEYGLKGIEVWHSKHPKYAIKQFSDLAFDMGMLQTGGSDCHGSVNGETPIMGKIKIPYSVVHEMKKYKQKQIRERT